ncbi:MAG TPA: hypothetical protein VF668_07965 [Pyrinomonadaceae bacterium]|jgi:hypothetical protein
MRSASAIFRHAALLLSLTLVTAACPQKGGKLAPVAGGRARVVSREDAGPSGAAQSEQGGVTVTAFGDWTAGGTDVSLEVHNTAAAPVSIDFAGVALSGAGGRTARLNWVVEYVTRDGKLQHVPVYNRAEKAGAGAPVLTVEPGARRSMQAGFVYEGADDRGGRLDERATLTVPLRGGAGEQSFEFVFLYAGR